MKARLIIALGLAIAALCSCNKENLNPSSESTNEGITMTLRASIAAPTKASVAAEGSVLKTTWDADEKISVLTLDAEGNVLYNDIFTASTAKGDRNADFTGSFHGGESPAAVVCYYPALTEGEGSGPFSSANGLISIDGIGKANGSFNLNASAVSQDASNSTSALSAATLLSGSASISGSTLNVTLGHRLSVLKISFDIASTDLAKVSAIELQSSKFQSFGSKGWFIVSDASGSIPNWNPSVSRNFAFSSEIAVSGSVVAYVPVVMNDMAENCAWTFTLIGKDGSDAAASYSAEKIFPADFSFEFGFYYPISVASLSKKAISVTDLSADGIANCYVVNAAGEYSIDCKMPDAANTLVIGTNATWCWATSGLWASQAEASAANMITDINYASDKITFTVPNDFSYGNALLSLLDAGGNIVYSWHIWLTQKITDVSVAGLKVMDRNLGAAGEFLPISKDRNATLNSRGLTYQWARKDPAPGSISYTAVESAAANIGTPGTTSYYVTNSGIQNVKAYPNAESAIPWSYANPTTIDASYTASIENAGKFPCTFIGAQGSHPAHGESVWPAAANPCPAGYHVMKNAEWDAIKALEAFEFKNDATGDAAIVYGGALTVPVCGYRNAGKVTGPSVDGRIWLETRVGGTTNNGYWAQIGKVDGYTNFYKEGTANKLHSASIRCVKN